MKKEGRHGFSSRNSFMPAGSGCLSAPGSLARIGWGMIAMRGRNWGRRAAFRRTAEIEQIARHGQTAGAGLTVENVEPRGGKTAARQGGRNRRGADAYNARDSRLAAKSDEEVFRRFDIMALYQVSIREPTKCE